MMHLSKKLAAREVTITFANTLFNHNRLLQSQADAHIPLPHEQGLDIRLVGLPDGLGYEEYVANDVPKQCAALIQLQPLLEDLVEKLVPPVTCIIADVFVLSTLPVAKRFGIPHVGFWTQNAASYAAHEIFTQGYCPPKENPVHDGEVQNLITCIPGCPPLLFREVPTFLQPCDPSDFVFGYLTDTFQRVVEYTWVLLNTFEELEEASLKFIWRKNMCTIGPVLPSEFFCNGNIKHKSGTSLWPEDRGCLDWLDKQKPSTVLYVSFGSIAVLSAQQIAEFAAGLEASLYPILMVVRPALMHGEAAVFPEGFAERMKHRSKFVEWAPQLEVLSHRAVGGFVTHCGWNSTLESICKAHTMLCWPYFADQMVDCRCVVDGWKIGLDFEYGEDGLVSRVEIEKKVRLLMEGERSKEMKERAMNLRNAALKAVVEGGPSHTNFETFINFLLSS